MSVSRPVTEEAIRPVTEEAIPSPAPALTGRVQEADRYEAVRQYSLLHILGVWAAVAVPMGVLAWIVAPWLRDHLGGRDPFIEALLMCLNVGLLWMVGLTMILVWREQRSLRWSHVRDALWLRAPRDPKTRRVGKRVWLWVLPFIVLSAVVNAGWIDPEGPLPRDLPNAIQTDRVEHFFSGNWGWFAMLVAVALLSPVVEELLFRGLLLPRMRAVFGRLDFVVNGALFGLYHLHQPWSMPASVIDGIVNQAYPSRRFQSTWMGIIVHTIPSFLIIGIVLALVLK